MPAIRVRLLSCAVVLGLAICRMQASEPNATPPAPAAPQAEAPAPQAAPLGSSDGCCTKTLTTAPVARRIFLDDQGQRSSPTARQREDLATTGTAKFAKGGGTLIRSKTASGGRKITREGGFRMALRATVGPDGKLHESCTKVAADSAATKTETLATTGSCPHGAHPKTQATGEAK